MSIIRTRYLPFSLLLIPLALALFIKLFFYTVLNHAHGAILAQPREHTETASTVQAAQALSAKHSGKPQAYIWQALPAQPPVPEDNPLTTDKIELGEKLFFDKRLSLDKSMSCSSCHALTADKGGSDGKATSVGINEQFGGRNAPSVLNAAFQKALFWDGRAGSLEQQALGPILNPIEMGVPDINMVLERLRQSADYQLLFKQAFGQKRGIDAETLAMALASYERTLITADTPYDRFVRGEQSALTAQQVRGMALFEQTGCIYCHSGAMFSVSSQLSTTTPYRLFPAIYHDDYENKYQLSKDKGGIKVGELSKLQFGLWRVPTLRNVSRTAPYFHNGSVAELKEAVKIMATVQLNKTITKTKQSDEYYVWSEQSKTFKVEQTPSLISEAEIDDIVAFLEALAPTKEMN